MRDDFNSPALIDADTQHAIQRAIDDDDASFMHLVDVLNLSKENDFRFIDLAGVDFSGSDLRGFDFTGANLRGSIGINVQQDHSTILTGAELDRSIFAYTAERDEYFQQFPEIEREYQRISGLYFLDQPSVLYDAAKRTTDRRKYQAICKRLYEETSSATVQTNMLLTLGMLDESRKDHIEFLLSICMRGKYDNREKLAMRQLSDLHRNDINVFNMLLLYIRSQKSDFRDISLAGVIQSKHFVTALSRIRAEILKLSTFYLRMLFIDRLAELCGPVMKCCVYDFKLRRVIDFREIVDYRIIVAASQRIRSLDNYQHLLEQDAEDLALEKIDALRKRLVPLILSERVEKAIKSSQERKYHRKIRSDALQRREN